VMIKSSLQLKLRFSMTFKFSDSIMTDNQKDAMLDIITESIHAQIMKLTDENRLDDAVALYSEWCEHFDESFTDVHVLVINDLTNV